MKLINTQMAPAQTPRKGRAPRAHQRNTSTNAVGVSDYESDAFNHIQTHIPPPTRTNTELNLSVLRHHNARIRTILSIAANAVVYIFTPATQSWEKSGVEGTLFVCDQEDERYCIVVLNRRGLDNLILDLGSTEDVEITPELLILRFQDGNGQKVMGLWIHKDKDDTREINAGLIQQCWQKAVEANSAIGDESVEVGRQISLQDLFNR
jgi:hypothetical protein